MSYAAQHSDGFNAGNGGGGINIPAILRAFRRQIPLMLIIFFVLSAVGWYFGGKLKRTYTAEARVIVTLSDDYVFQSMEGANNGGLVMTPDSVTLNEIAIMNNPRLIDEAITEIGLARLFPDDVTEYLNSEGLERDHIRHELLSDFESAFWVAARPKSSVIDMRFEHEDPEVAKDTLNQLIMSYKAARLIVFNADAKDIIGDRRVATEDQLLTVDTQIAAFLNRNNVGDFESERAGVRERTEALRAELNALRGSMREAEAALFSTEDRLRQTNATIDLYVDDRASQRVAQAELERKQLLAKYLPSSDPVKAKEREIIELRQLIASAGGAATGGRRVGPNPIHQSLMTERNKFQAMADSYREKEYVLQAQLNSADGKVRKLSTLSPTYENLLREKKTLEASLEQLNAREQVALVDQAQANINNENVKMINEPGLSRKGRNMKKIVQLLSVIGAAFTALMVGLLGMFLDPSIYGSPNPARVPGPRNNERDQDVNSGHDYAPQTIPEPVQPYMPQQVPAYAPAAQYAQPLAQAGVLAAGSSGYSAYSDQSYAQADGQMQSGYVDPYAYVDPNAYAYADPNTYVDPNAYAYTDQNAYAGTAQANPYEAQDYSQSVHANPYETQSYGVAQTNQANPYEAQTPMSASDAASSTGHVEGPNGELIPVIGQTTQAV